MFGFLPNNLFTAHRAQNTTGLSPRLWGRVTGSMMSSSGDKRLVLIGDDFLAMNHLATTYANVNSEVGYTAVIDAGGTITQLVDEKGGVIALTTDGTDEDEIWIAAGDGTGHLGMISDTAADAHLTAFECRFKISSITDAVMSMFVGLAAPGSAAVEFVVDATGALKATTQLIGFRTLLDGDLISFVWQAVADSAVVIGISSAKVPVADTFMKLGFVYDPEAPAAKRITVYADNVELSTYVTATQIAAATFPDAEALTFRAAQKQIGATAGELALDWWAFGQLV